MPPLWKQGRGKLGVFAPLHGTWVAESTSPMGAIRCVRTLRPVLDGKFLQLDAAWTIGSGGKAKQYDECAIIGVGDDGTLAFWSFTSDGKRSQGWLADVTDIHPEAIGFEADMPAGRARMAYWPDPDGGFHWAVESRTKKGWNRFTEHQYRAGDV